MSPLLRTVLGDQAPLALRERNIAFVLKGATAIAKLLDCALRFEAVAVRLINRIACDPKLIASHACSSTAAATAAIDVASLCAFLLPDLGDAPALARGQRDGALIVDVAAPIAEKLDGPLSFETISVIFVKLQEFAELGAAMSGVGVIASVVYVSIQIRHNTRAVRASAFQQVVNSFAAISFDIAKDKNLVDLCLRAGRDFPALDEVERAQYSLMLLSFLRRSENVFFRPRFACFTANIGPVSEKA